MYRRAALLILVAATAVGGGCARQESTEDPADAAFATLREAWNTAETPADKAALAEAYLVDHPDSDHSGTIAGIIAHYRGSEMEDPAGAWQAIEAALARIEDPEHRFEVAMAGFELADHIEIPLDLDEVASSLAAVRELDYTEQEQVVQAALELEAWRIAADHADAALALATPEQYRLDYPDLELSDEQAAARARHRRASALADSAWARFNLGEGELAAAHFAAAEEAGSVNYLGVPATPLYRYWGRAELAGGNLDRALELLATETIFGENREQAEPFLREAYAAKYGSEEGLEEFLWATRNRIAKAAEDFELLDYEGAAHRLSDSAGEVTLLAFWFPT